MFMVATTTIACTNNGSTQSNTSSTDSVDTVTIDSTVCLD